jgi:hypothetical protein
VREMAVARGRKVEAFVLGLIDWAADGLVVDRNEGGEALYERIKDLVGVVNVYDGPHGADVKNVFGEIVEVKHAKRAR